MFKIRFGTPEEFVPSRFCEKLTYNEKTIKYDVKKLVFKERAGGCTIEFPIENDEQIFGFGLQLQGFNHTRRKLSLRVNSDPVAYTGDSHAPVPFFVTNKGYGMYIDTARAIDVYCGFPTAKNLKLNTGKSEIIDDVGDLYVNRDGSEKRIMTIDIPSAKGIDIYIFEGTTITDIVSQYNMLAGGGCHVPEWGLGTTYRVYTKFNEDNVLDIAKYFKDNDLKIDTIGLEPGWQTAAYSCSYVFDTERFKNYKDTVKSLKSMGYHINLWEHAFVSPKSPIFDSLYKHSGKYTVFNGIVPDFSIAEAKNIFADYHKKHLVDIGIDGFKLDECDGSDFIKSGDWSFPNRDEFPGGMDGEQYHSMFGILYMQTILKALGEKETLSSVRNAGALSSCYPFVLYSDLYGHREFIRGIVNSGFSGLLWTPEVREGKDKKDFLRRLQTNVFSAQCLINAWYLDKAPWIALDCEKEVRDLLDLRASLVPMLKCAFDEYEKSGKPPIRALVSDYTDDAETYKIDDEYIFCDNLIVAPLTAESDKRMVYLPTGKWKNFFTGEDVPCGWFEFESENIPVFKKEK